MNEQVTKLIWEADQYSLSNLSRGRDSEFFHTIAMNKLAELIVRECMKVSRKADGLDAEYAAWYLIQQHFGVEE